MRSGLCECGCGGIAPLAKLTNNKLGHKRGQPMRFIRGHVGYLKRHEVIEPSMWTAVDTGYASPCWLWTLTELEANGYGRVYLRGQRMLVHRAMYEQARHVIGVGKTLDHLCRQRSCVNPDHLEEVSRGENVRRGAKVKLSMDIARRIRASDVSNVLLADQYGVTPSMISAIRSGRRWRE